MTVPSLPNPYAAQLSRDAVSTAWALGEMTLAAHQTIALRLWLLGEAAFSPGALKDPEFQDMVWEKVDAAGESSRSVARGLTYMGQGLWTWATRQAEASVEATAALMSARQPMDVWTAQTRYMSACTEAAEAAVGAFTVAAGRLGRRGLAPVHRRTRANARRLADERLTMLLG